MNKSINREDSQVKQDGSENQVTKEYHLGLDISTAVVGFVILEPNGTMVKMDHVKLNIVKFPDLFTKVDWTIERLITGCDGYKIKKIFVEANAKMFTPGFSSADTILTLAKMNALVSYLSHKFFNVPVTDVNVTSARSRIGYKNNRLDKRTVKEKVREFVVNLHPEFPIKTHVAKTGKSKGQSVMNAEVADEIDAFVIARGGQILNP
jgi:hypothetical protein